MLVIDRPVIRKPWGVFKILYTTPGVVVKDLHIYPHKRFSLQYHKNRTEYWTFYQGRALVTIDSRQYTMRARDSIMIPAGCHHRVEASDEVVKFIEVQVALQGDPDEDDIVRLADDFGRV